MNKIDNFLKDHNLKFELMNDDAFINDSKKLFEMEDLEFSEDELGDINENLENVRKMSEKQLAQIVGGSPSINLNTSVAKPATKKGIAVEATTTILGTVIGATLGFTLGGFKFKTTNNYEVQEDASKQLKTISKTREFSPGSAVFTGGLTGLAGSALGFQLGQLIVKKYNL